MSSPHESEPLLNEPHQFPLLHGLAEAVSEYKLAFDENLKFYRDQDGNGQVVAFRRQRRVESVDNWRSVDGTAMVGNGLYVGNTPESVACYGVRGMQPALMAVRLPEHNQLDVMRYDNYRGFSTDLSTLWNEPKIAEYEDPAVGRERQQAIDRLLGVAKFITWRVGRIERVCAPLFAKTRPVHQATHGLWRDDERVETLAQLVR